MRRLGISVYPEKSDKETIMNYIHQAGELGFSRLFTCLLSVQKPRDEIIKEFQDIIACAKDNGMEVIVDVSPRVFKDLDISYQDLSFFKEIGADGVRLDAGFSGSEEALMTFNPQNLKIEINMSNDVHTIDTIMDYQPNKYNLLGCHNFYPHEFCGLDLEYFQNCTKRFAKYGIPTAAFVCSQAVNAFGPWPVTDGLPTVELLRRLPLDVQVKFMVAQGNIDDIIISNCYPTQQELDQLKNLPLDLVCFDVQLAQDISDVERSIILDELHFNRGDKNPNMIRSTQSRVKYKGHHFALHNVPEMIHRGDIVIESSEAGHYAGELQIALHDMKNSGKSNVVGHIRPEEDILLDQIRPWQKFRFRQVK